MSPKLKPETLDKRKADILKAASTCFARKGYHQTTMDDIAEEAGLSKGGLYWHFGSKKELFLALFESLINDSLLSSLPFMDAQVSAGEKLCTMQEMLTSVVISEEYQELMLLLIDIWLQNRQDPEVNQVAIRMYNELRRPLVELIEEGMRSGEFKPVNASALASVLLALYDGLMVQWMIDETIVDWEATSETLMNTLIAGLLTSGPVAKSALNESEYEL